MPSSLHRASTDRVLVVVMILCALGAVWPDLPRAASVRATAAAVDAERGAARTLRITRWPTQDLVLRFGERPVIDVGERGVGYYDTVPLVQEARQVLEDGTTGPWRRQSRDTLMGAGYTYAAFVLSVPGPGQWQVRVRSLATKEYRSTMSDIRNVSMLEPVCRDRATNADGSLSQCRITTWSGDTYDRQYWLQWAGELDLVDTAVAGRAVYLHGDGGDPSWPTDPQGTLTTIPEDLTGDVTWALEHGYVVVNPMATQRWGSTVSIYGGWNVARGLGRDLAGLGRWLDAGSDVVYWGHSGGSWFLTESYIPAGIDEAPGPVVLNCGAASPYRPRRADDYVPPYGNAWTWLPSRQRSLRSEVALRFNYGTKDSLAASIRSAFRTYGDLKFPVNKKTWKGDGHCEPDFVAATTSWWEQHLSQD